MIESIPTEQLQPHHLPARGANWREISVFAHTFNGYEYWGSFKACAEVALNQHHETIEELRTCLFFLFRSIRHVGYGPSEEDIAYMHYILELLRERLLERTSTQD